MYGARYSGRSDVGGGGGKSYAEVGIVVTENMDAWKPTRMLVDTGNPHEP